MPSQSLSSFWMTLQFFSPTAKNKDGGVVISMPQEKVTKTAVQALVGGTSGLSGAKVDERDGNITVFIPEITRAALGHDT